MRTKDKGFAKRRRIGRGAGRGAGVGEVGEAPGWVRRLVAARGVRLSEKTLYWWGVHLSRFLKHCRNAGGGASENLPSAIGQYLEAMGEVGTAKAFQVEQARQALDVFRDGVENWRWLEDGERAGPAFRLKAASPVATGPEARGARGEELGSWGGVSGAGGEVDGSRFRHPTVGTHVPDSTPDGQHSTTDVQGGQPASTLDNQHSTTNIEGVPSVTSGGEAWDGRGGSAGLLEAMRRALRVRHYRLRTEEAYLQWAGRFGRFCEYRDAQEWGNREARRFLEHLALERNVSASTQNQAFSALLFLFGTVLGRPLGDMAGTIRARRPERLPVVLSREEARRLLAVAAGTVGLMVRLLYGTGMRLMEVLRLRVKDIDFGRGQITVREGKGAKDRTVMLPECLRDALMAHLDARHGAARRGGGQEPAGWVMARERRSVVGSNQRRSAQISVPQSGVGRACWLSEHPKTNIRNPTSKGIGADLDLPTPSCSSG